MSELKGKINFVDNSTDPIPASIDSVLSTYFGIENYKDSINLQYIENQVDDIWTFRITFEMLSLVLESIGGSFVKDYDKSLAMFATFLEKELRTKRLKNRVYIRVREKDKRFTDLGL